MLDCRFREGAGPNVTMLYMLDHLMKLNERFRFIVVHHKDQPIPEYEGVERIFVPFRNRLLEFLWVQFRLPALIKRHGIDVYHSLKHVGPLRSRVPSILHLREAGHFRTEGREAFRLSRVNSVYWTQLLHLALRRVDQVASVSQYCKDVVVDDLAIPSEKIAVVYQGLDPRFRVLDDAEVAAVRVKYGLPPNYILCVGNLYPHKNYDTVVRMLASLRKRRADDTRLVLVGDAKYATREFRSLIRELGLEESIVFTGFLRHDDLPAVYNGASVFVFAPIAASFPNPCLEAFACGVPVVASDRGAIAEITAGAAVMLDDPRDVDAMLDAVAGLLDDANLRAELRSRGFERIKGFSWSLSARKLLGIYSAMSSSGRERNAVHA